MPSSSTHKSSTLPPPVVVEVSVPTPERTARVCFASLGTLAIAIATTVLLAGFFTQDVLSHDDCVRDYMMSLRHVSQDVIDAGGMPPSPILHQDGRYRANPDVTPSDITSCEGRFYQTLRDDELKTRGRALQDVHLKNGNASFAIHHAITPLLLLQLVDSDNDKIGEIFSSKSPSGTNTVELENGNLQVYTFSNRTRLAIPKFVNVSTNSFMTLSVSENVVMKIEDDGERVSSVRMLCTNYNTDWTRIAVNGNMCLEAELYNYYICEET